MTLDNVNYGIFLIIIGNVLMTLDYVNYGVFLIMGNAGFISSTVCNASGPRKGLSGSALKGEHGSFGK